MVRADYYDVGVLPDQRSPEVTAMSLERKVSGQVTPPHERGHHLLTLAQRLMARAELWGLLGGAPLVGPRPCRLVRSDRVPAAPQQAREAPSPPGARTTVHALQTLRDHVAARLAARRHDPAFPLRGHSLEECCEVLVLLTCGQDIVLLVDRDPWRWEHTAEALRAAEGVFGAELEALRALTRALSEAIGAEQEAEQLLVAFVKGASGEGTPS